MHLIKCFFLLITSSSYVYAVQGITNRSGHYLGGDIAIYCIVKCLSYKYNIPYYYTPFDHSSLFVLDSVEKNINTVYFTKQIRLLSEQDLVKNLNNHNVLFWTYDLPLTVREINPDWVVQIKSLLQLKDKDYFDTCANILPKDAITVAVHIRKGNGGGQHYDGEQTSRQFYDFDAEQIEYINNKLSYPFDWNPFTRLSDQSFMKGVDTIVAWQTKFPPNQYYLNEILRLSSDLEDKLLYVQIFTDDKNPEKLCEEFRYRINKSNVIIHHEPNVLQSHTQKIGLDIYSMTKFDVLIRSQSYFARMVELIGNFKMVIYPIASFWHDDCLVMSRIAVRGSCEQFYS